MMSGDFAVCGQWQSCLRLSVILKSKCIDIYIYGDDEGEDGEWW